MAIIRGTTPTIEFIFDDIDPNDITTAVLSIKQNNKTIIERDLSSSYLETVNEIQVLAWKLTQEETFQLSSRIDAYIVCDWKLVDGTRGRSHSLITPVGEPGKDEVI